MTSKDLQDFFDQRPALPVNPIADEANIPRRTLHYKLTEGRRTTKEQAEKLLPVLRKYGYGYED